MAVRDAVGTAVAPGDGVAVAEGDGVRVDGVGSTVDENVAVAGGNGVGVGQGRAVAVSGAVGVAEGVVGDTGRVAVGNGVEVGTLPAKGRPGLPRSLWPLFQGVVAVTHRLLSARSRLAPTVAENLAYSPQVMLSTATALPGA